jgi:N-acetylmuramoyl-L-alanine amidase
MEVHMASKIFVRERRKVEKGEKKPRFRVVGVSGSDVKVYVKHIRKKELDQISSESGAEVVYLNAGQGGKDGGGKGA